MSQIKKIHAIEILDSRGNPTIEAEVTLTSGHTGRALRRIRSIKLRDHDTKRYAGKGVLKP